MFAGWARIGGRFEVRIEMVKDLSLLIDPSLTPTVAAKFPASENPGARWMFPVAVPAPGVVVVTVMNVGPETFEKVNASPHASVPVMT